MSLSSKITNVTTRIATAKPYLIGGAIGAVATVAVAFNAGWVVSIGAHHQALTKARLDTVATMCAQQASAHWAAEGHAMSGLEGWDNDERDALAKRFTPSIDDVSADEITSLCGRMLRRA